MRTKLKFKQFKRCKEIDEQLHEISHWTSDFEFYKLELDFIKHLLQFYPFKKTRMNLFERIQLYIQKIDSFYKKNTSIVEKIYAHEDALNSSNFTIIQHETIAELVFVYKQEYIDFKREIYEYIDGIIK